MKSKQYTVRNIPPSVDKSLRQRAAEKGESLNSVLLAALVKEAGVGIEPRLHHDLDELIGSWVSDPALDRALKEQRALDRRDWR